MRINQIRIEINSHYSMVLTATSDHTRHAELNMDGRYHEQDFECVAGWHANIATWALRLIYGDPEKNDIIDLAVLVSSL